LAEAAAGASTGAVSVCIRRQKLTYQTR